MPEFFERILIANSSELENAFILLGGNQISNHSFVSRDSFISITRKALGCVVHCCFKKTFSYRVRSFRRNWNKKIAR